MYIGVGTGCGTGTGTGRGTGTGTGVGHGPHDFVQPCEEQRSQHPHVLQ
jgi:hypothetical protein